MLIELTKDQINYQKIWLLKLAIIFFILTIFVVCGFLLFEKKYQYKIYPGVWLNNYDLSNKTINEARQLIDQQINEINQKGINFTYQNNEGSALSTIKNKDIFQTFLK